MSKGNDCRHAEVLINRHLDHELATGEGAELDRHVKGCAACAREFRQARGLNNLFMLLEVPASQDARNQTKQRLAAFLKRDDTAPRARSTPLPLPLRKRNWMAPAAIAAAVLLLVGSLNFSGWLRDRDANSAQQSQFRLRHADRLAVLENLSQNALQAAHSPAAQQLARVHEDLADALVAAAAFDRANSGSGQEAALAYVRTLHKAVVPAIRAGHIGSSAAQKFDAQRRELDRINTQGEATLAAAAALSAYAADVLKGKTLAPPLISVPEPGKSLLWALSESSIAMGEADNVAWRGEVLDALAARVIQEMESGELAPVALVRVQRMALELSVRGIQVLAQQAADDPLAAERFKQLLENDAARLAYLEAAATKLPPQHAGDMSTVIGVAKQANTALQQQVKNAAGKGRSDALPRTVPGNTGGVAAAPQVAAEKVIPIVVPGAKVDAAALPAVNSPTAKPAVDAASGAGASGASSENGAGQSDTGKALGGDKDAAAKERIALKEGKDAGASGKEQGIKESSSKATSQKEGKGGEHGGGRERSNRAERPIRPEHPARPEKPERPETSGRPDGPERGERGIAADRGGRPERTERAERPERPERPADLGRPEKPERPDGGKPGQPDKPDNPGNPNDAPGKPLGKPDNKPDNSGKPDAPGKPDNPNKPDSPEKPDNPSKPDKPEKSGKK